MTRKSIINNERMRCWLACIYVNWDDEDGGYHDIADNYEFDKDSVGDVRYWKRAAAIWRKED